MINLISVEKENGLTITYGQSMRFGEDGERMPAETQEEYNRKVYRTIAEDAKREQFEENILSIVLGYLKKDSTMYDNLQIRLTSEEGSVCETNISIKKLYTVNQ